MNERIDELAFEAGCHRHKFWDPKHPDLEGFIISQAVLDKFAELIIRECITQCENVGEIAEQTNHGEMARKTKATSNGCAQMIKWRFGLE